MKRIIVALLVGGALFATVAFAAASITDFNAGNLSQGQGDVGNCAEWASLTYNTVGSNPVRVDSVNVADSADCNGATATVEVFDGSFATLTGVGTCSIAAGACTADLPGDPDVALVDSARLTLSGP